MKAVSAAAATTVLVSFTRPLVNQSGTIVANGITSTSMSISSGQLLANFASAIGPGQTYNLAGAQLLTGDGLAIGPPLAGTTVAS